MSRATEEMETLKILQRLRGEASFDFGVSVEWGRSGFDFLNGAVMHHLGITPEGVRESTEDPS